MLERRKTDLVPVYSGLPQELSWGDQYLAKIRPEWQGTPLVRRVVNLLPVDASSACQRLLNAAGHDLRSKIRTIGLDLAKEAAKSSGLPPINSSEDLENYPTARLYDLAYRLSLFNRADWRRLHRAYEIRCDLEHEDDEYEASIGDLVSIFEAAIDVVLSREPIQVIQLQEINDVVESDAPVHVSQELIEDYRDAPPQRQTEILSSLSFWYVDDQKPEIVRANCFRLLRRFSPLAPSGAKIELAEKLAVRIGRGSADVATAQVAITSGAFPFIRKRQQRVLVGAFIEQFDKVKPHWRQNHYHSELLDDFAGGGGFASCPDGSIRPIVRWMVEAYIGEPGGYGTFGQNRAVFYSNTAAHRIEKLLQSAPPSVKGHITYVAKETGIQKLARISEQEIRLDSLLELTSSEPAVPEI